MDYDRQFDDNEWTPEELAQLRALEPERAPNLALKARTVSSLQARNLIGARWSPGLRSVLVLAAASVVFVAGTIVGYAAGARRATLPATAAPAAAAALAKADSSGAAQRQQTRQIIWF
jgi:hypothetical protein